jgi:hypothetical protein
VTGFQLGGIALGGEDADGNRIMSVPAMPLESRVASGNLNKQTIEDLQFFGFYGIAQMTGAAGPLENFERVVPDPPDLRVKVEGKPPMN